MLTKACVNAHVASAVLLPSVCIDDTTATATATTTPGNTTSYFKIYRFTDLVLLLLSVTLEIWIGILTNRNYIIVLDDIRFVISLEPGI